MRSPGIHTCIKTYITKYDSQYETDDLELVIFKKREVEWRLLAHDVCDCDFPDVSFLRIRRKESQDKQNLRGTPSNRLVISVTDNREAVCSLVTC